MDVIILTGMSGAGKSLAANYLEDMGFFCIDNLPPNILPELISSFVKKQNSLPHQDVDDNKMAFVIDIRSSELFEEIFTALDRLNQLSVPYRIIFLDATDQVLIAQIISGLSVLAIALVPEDRFFIVLILIAICGLSSAYINSPATAIMQAQVEKHMQGRVMSIAAVPDILVAF